ncbi:hypothetical protein CC80DRAFT_112389 [Byssothecium circinans]|uniref:Uncharacterized protein n=1 Tax=Byssothecium circinans TaxID=147558 RepID=A0A6A5TTN0_9PLEO|nr:hypothetical protein CC80DRAFT_112389 [Byssothecium circinans]
MRFSFSGGNIMIRFNRGYFSTLKHLIAVLSCEDLFSSFTEPVILYDGGKVSKVCATSFSHPNLDRLPPLTFDGNDPSRADDVNLRRLFDKEKLEQCACGLGQLWRLCFTARRAGNPSPAKIPAFVILSYASLPSPSLLLGLIDDLHGRIFVLLELEFHFRLDKPFFGAWEEFQIAMVG